MSRPYIDMTIQQLEALVEERKDSRTVLGQVYEELTYRTTERAQRLRREVEALLGGEVAMPTPPPRLDRPEDQIDLLGEEGS
jgi:hypothetical protein